MVTLAAGSPAAARSVSITPPRVVPQCDSGRGTSAPVRDDRVCKVSFLSRRDKLAPEGRSQEVGMPGKARSVPAVKVLLTGLAMGESPRWHQGRLWFADWGAQETVALDPRGKSEVVLRVPFGLPFSIDWPPDGRLLVISGREGLLMRQEADKTLAVHADLRGVSGLWNEIVVDGRGNAYINGGSQVMTGGLGIIALVAANGSVRKVADGIAFPNGMAVTPDNSTLIIAESYGKRLTAFDIARDGSL